MLRISHILGAGKASRYCALTCAIVNCLCAASVTLFSLYAPEFQSKLGYNQLQVNAVSIAGELGMSILVPFFGAWTDRYGPAPVSLAAAAMMLPSYFVSAAAFQNDWNYMVFLVCFFFIGGATGALYISSLTTCAKTFHENKGFFMAIPIAAYGLSSFFLTQIAATFFYDDTGRHVDVPRLFIFFGILLGSVGLLGYVGLEIIPPQFTPPNASEIAEAERLLGPDSDYTTHESYNSTSSSQEPTAASYSVNNNNSVKEEETVHEIHRRLVKNFFKDKTAWSFYLASLMALGSSEMLNNNLGTLIDTITPNPPRIPTQVSLWAVFSTLSRIIAGAAADYISHSERKSPISRMWILLAYLFIMGVASIAIAAGLPQYESGRYFWPLSVGLGASYGGLFSIFSTVVMQIWGSEAFATNWSILSTSAAAGAVIFGVLYGRVYDNHATPGQVFCYGTACYRLTFICTSSCIMLSLAIFVLSWRLGWVQRPINL